MGAHIQFGLPQDTVRYHQLYESGSLLYDLIIDVSGNVGEGSALATGQALTNSLNSLSGFTIGASGYLYNLIQQSANGVISINGQSGTLNIVGTGGIVVNTLGQNIYVSGQDWALRSELTQSGIELILRDNSISGAIDSRLFVTGQTLWQHSQNNALNLSGNLANSGAALIAIINATGQALEQKISDSISGLITTGDADERYYPQGTNPSGYATTGNVFSASGALAGRIYESGLALYNQLYNTGQLLWNRDVSISGGLEIRITNSGQSAVAHANGIGAILSGDLTQTGIQLVNLINIVSSSLHQSGQLLFQRDLDISGALRELIRQADADVNSINGQSGTLQITGAGSVVVLSGGAQLITISGDTGAYANFATKTELTQTGVAAISHANGIGAIISGNLTQTGVVLFARDASISGGLEARILATGAAAIAALNVGLVATGTSAVSHANGIGINLSGNLAQSGAVLITRDNSISGYLQGQIDAIGLGTGGILNNVVFTTGSQFIFGTKYFAGNTYIDNLYVTGTVSVVNTQDIYVGSNWLVLNATGGARDAALFIATGLTGENATGAILGLDVPSNTWRFGFGSQKTDLINLPRIASGEAVDLLDARLGQSGSNLLTQINTVAINLTLTGQALFNRDAAISGGLETRITATGNAAITHANGIGANLSGNLAQTGATLISIINNLSGAFTGSIYQTGLNLYNQIYNSGQLLFNRDSAISGGLEARITTTGNSAITHANGIGINLSGNLTQTGATLFTRDTAISGGLEVRIIATGNAAITHANSIGQTLSGNLAQTGATLLTADLALSGALTGRIYQSGIDLYNQLYNTGQLLFNRDTIISGGLEARIFTTGAAAIAHANGIGINLSGNLAQTGATLLSVIANTGQQSVLFTSGASGILQSQINSLPTIAYVNGIGINLSGNLTITGATLFARDSAISGALEGRIAQTGQSAFLATLGASGALQTQINNLPTVAYVNGIGINISGNLAQTGAALAARDALISGVLQTQINNIAGGTGNILTNVVFSSGSQTISGQKTFVAAVLSGNTIIPTGQILTFGTSGAGIRLEVYDNSTIAFVGSQGQLFSIKDSLTGSLMAVTDSAGLPILEVFDSDRVVLGAYGANAFVVSGSGVAIGSASVNPSRALYISGDTRYDGHFYSGETNIANIFATISALQLTGSQSWNAANNNGINLSGRLAQTGATILSLINDLSGHITGGSTAFVVGPLATGSDEYWISFTKTFIQRPIVNVEIELSGSNNIYGMAISGRSTSGFYALFTDVIEDSGVYLNVFATLPT